VSSCLALRGWRNNGLGHSYSDGSSTMGFHADSTEERVAGTGIAVVSLGAERAITLRNQSDRDVQEGYLLRSGSLLYMPPAMQRN
jgi:alkylated DNA repair dioxygenase AlkB